MENKKSDNVPAPSLYGVHKKRKGLVLIFLIGAIIILALAFWIVNSKNNRALNNNPFGNLPTDSSSKNNQESNLGQPSISTPEREIRIKGFTYVPTILEIKAGTKVIWKNWDIQAHTVTAENGEFSSGPIEKDENFSYTFNKPGIYRYRCDYHKQMTGTIIVK